MRGTQRRILSSLLGTGVMALGACSTFDVDMRDIGNVFDTSAAVERASPSPRPAPDDRGVISYPNYQVVVARRGDTVADVAARVGLEAGEVARYNGVPADAVLNRGELLALPQRVAEPSPATGAIGTGPILPPSADVDVASLAGAALDRADGLRSSGQVGVEPVRHKVVRGETAYSIARSYGVTPAALADWNGLGPDLTVREGQYVLIPPAAGQAPATPAAFGAERVSTPVPFPPSASQPLPEEDPVPVTATPTAVPEDAPESPDLGATQTEASVQADRMVTPVSGSIIRDFRKGRNEGIDIAADAGTPVKAAEAGTVAAITRDTDQVPIVVLRHEGGLLTVYANVDDLKVEKGDAVARGQEIAAVRAGDPAFLHFEVRDGVDAVDPNDYLN